MPRLIDPWFGAKFYGEATDRSFRTSYPDGSLLPWNKAQGLFLWCPCAYGNDAKAHGLLVPFNNTPSGVTLPAEHGPLSRDGKTRPRWNVSGTGLDDLTITPSIAVGPADDECWHGFITNGEVQ